MLRILVVDDNDDVRAMLELTCRREGFEVFGARNGAQALEIAQRQRLDLIVTDVFMPERDGVETIVAIREQFPHVKIVAMSGWQSAHGPDYLAIARELGAAATLRKPFAPPELIRVVRRLAESRPD